MIAFRAPNDVTAMLEDAGFVTGVDRTKLILTTLRRFLPQVVIDFSPDHEERMRAARREFEKKLKAQASHLPNESDSEVAEPSAVNRGSSARGKSRSGGAKRKKNTPQKFPSGD